MPKVDKIGPWSREKLELLNKYLVTYTSIMNTPKNKRWCKECCYIDAFAGSVTPWDKENQEYIDGSPRVALNTSPSFDSYDFIEIDSKRYKENLIPLKFDFPDKNINFHLGDCNEILCDKILTRFPNKCAKRAFIFLDPYGLELNWKSVESIGNTGVFDAFINFSVMGVVRQLTKTIPEVKNREAINRLMGAEDWIKIAYKKTSQLTLSPDFSPIIERQNYQLAEKVADYYRSRLLTCFKYATPPVIMRNSKGGPLYALILASHAQIAVNKMKEIFKRQERKKLNIC